MIFITLSQETGINKNFISVFKLKYIVAFIFIGAFCGKLDAESINAHGKNKLLRLGLKETTNIYNGNPEILRLSGGVGVCFTVGRHNSFLTGLGLNIGIQQIAHLFSVRGTHNSHKGSYFRSSEKVYDFGFMYGRYKRFEDIFTSLSMGCSFVGGSSEKLLYKNSNSFSTIGVPIEGQIFWKPDSSIGIGLTGFANINYRSPFFGLLFSLRVDMTENQN